NPRNGTSTNDQNNGNTQQPNSTLYFLEQNYLQKHQQRQRLHSAAPSTSRSFLQSRASNNNILPPSIPSQIAKKMLKTNFLQQHHQPPESTRSEPDLRPLRRDEINSRWFVAIQDHQPRMGGINEELPFRRHQLIKVYGDVDMNGFFWAEARGRYGFVPFNKLVEIAKDDLFLAAEQHAGTSMPEGGQQQPWTGGISSSQRRMKWGSIKSRSYEHTESQGRYGNYHGGVQADYEPGRGSQPLYYPDPYIERTARRGRQLPEYRGATVGVGAPIEQRALPNIGDAKTTSGGVREKENAALRYRSPQVNGGTRQGRDKKRIIIPEMSTKEEEEQMAEISKYQQQYSNNSKYYQQQKTSLDEEEQQQDDGFSYDEQQQGGGEYQQMRGIQSQLMIAKYDYDSRHLSPNVDAEQVELSFRQGDLITIFGPMDEDGFYLGELNGIRGLVPSNFLQPAPQTTEPVLHSRPKALPSVLI
uniref:SH3 domain-containing protein n=1 Tax=Meloidogyne incognita TaxID=6306 RepID=A0A914NPV9_MELIC